MEKNNNEFKNWKCKVDVFRGLVKGKLEALEKLIETHCKGAETRRVEYVKELKDINTKIGTIEQYMAARKAVQKHRASIWGFVGGLFSLLVGFILYKILPKLFG